MPNSSRSNSSVPSQRYFLLLYTDLMRTKKYHHQREKTVVVQDRIKVSSLLKIQQQKMVTQRRGL